MLLSVAALVLARMFVVLARTLVVVPRTFVLAHTFVLARTLLPLLAGAISLSLDPFSICRTAQDGQGEGGGA